MTYTSEHRDLYLSLIKQALVAWRAGRAEEAASCLEVALELIPEAPEALAYQSALAELRGEAERAIHWIQALQKITQSQDKTAELFSEACEALSQREWPEEGATSRESERAEMLRASIIEMEITPASLKLPLQGYATDEPRYPSQIHSPLMMQVLMLEDHLGERALWVSADVFAFDPTMTALVRKYAALWGIKPEGVILNASHTHYAPGTLERVVSCLGEAHTGFARSVTHAIIRALPRLRQTLAPVSLEVGSTEALLGIFRRSYDEQGRLVGMTPNQDRARSYQHVGLARLSWRDQPRDLILVNLGSHPTEFGNIAMISSAFVGGLRASLQADQDMREVMFLQGCAGDHKSGYDDGESLRWIEQFSEVDEMIKPVVSAIRAKLQSGLRSVTGALLCTAKQVSLSLNAETPPEQLSLDQRGQPYEMIFDLWLKQLKARPELTHDQVEVELIHHRIGDWSITALSGEPVSRYARWIHEEFDPEGFVLGYTNDIAMYLPDEQMIMEGGYEADESHTVYLRRGPLLAGCELLIKDAVSQCFERTLDVQNKLRDLMTSTPIHQVTSARPKRAFFVLSTGRSGTQTLAHLLAAATNAEVWHHPEPNMIMETLYAYQERIKVGETFWLGRSHIIAPTWDQGLIHGETDHNMTPFAVEIARDIPEARFLVLVRDPREFIRSGMRRGYYIAGGPWDEGRLKPLPQQAQQLGWARMNSFEKVCWLWTETYRKINKYIEEIGVDRVKVVRFEDLINGPQVASEIFDFLSLDGFTQEHAERVLSQKLNAQRGGDFPHPREWPPEWHRVAWGYCGEVAQGYGYPECYAK